MSGTDLYAMLGVEKSATTEQVRNAYKEKAMQLHPDRGRDPRVFSGIQAAYDTLSDPKRRSQYDSAKPVGGGAVAQYAQSFVDSDAGARTKTVSISKQADCRRPTNHEIGRRWTGM